MIFHDGYDYQWAPRANVLAFKSGDVLNVINVTFDKAQDFKNVSLGVGGYSWLPDGSGFLVSSTSHLLPTGWTSVQLFTVSVDANLDKRKIRRFFTLPLESKDFFAIGTTS